MSEKVMTTFRIEQNLHQRLKRVLEERGMTMQGFIILAIKQLLEDYDGSGMQKNSC